MATSKNIRRSNLLILLEEFQSQAALARALEVEPAYVSALLTGAPKGRDIGDKTARKIEAKFNKPEGWMDQVNAPPIGKRPSLRHVHATGGESSSLDSVAILERLADVPLVSIPRLEIRASMGGGELRPGQDAIVGAMELSAEWVRRNLPDITSIANLRVITGYGDSMEPTFRDGDILIVDTGVREVRVDTIYVFALEGDLYVKTLQRLPSVGVRVISDNKKYDAFMLAEGSRTDVEVIGRVVWAWNGRKL